MTEQMPSQVQSLPLDAGDFHHLLLLGPDVHPAELEALALSLYSDATWISPGHLQLTAGSDLTGPWHIDVAARAQLELPTWATQAWIVGCPAERGGQLPHELAGNDLMQDALRDALPQGKELDTLTDLRKISRRLAGAIRLQGNPKLIVPDPDSAVNLRVLAPVWLSADEVLQAVQEVLPGAYLPVDPVQPAQLPPPNLEFDQHGIRESLVAQLGQEERQWLHAEADAFDAAALEMASFRDSFAVISPVQGMSQIHILVESEDYIPLAVLGQPWANEPVASYTILWSTRDEASLSAARPNRVLRRERVLVMRLIEAAAVALSTATNGLVLDEDGFLISVG